MKPIIIPIKQGTPAWKEWRIHGVGERNLNGVTASMAPPIDGTSTWCTQAELWHLVTGRTPEAKPHPAMLEGTRQEPLIRAAYMQEFGISVTPACVEHPELRWMRASLDGYARDDSQPLNLGVEIKWMNYHDYCETCRGNVPEHYAAQVTHERSAALVDAIHFYGMPADKRWGPPALVIVEKDTKAEAALIEKELAFLEYWNKDECPPLAKADTLIRNDADFLGASWRWAQLEHAVKILSSWRDRAKTELCGLTEHNHEECKYARVTRVNPEKGAVDWESYARSLPGFSEAKAEKHRKAQANSYYKPTNKSEADPRWVDVALHAFNTITTPDQPPQIEQDTKAA